MTEKPTPNDHPLIEPLRTRWSPLAFDPAPVSEATLASLFEAARWAPSSFNEQPARFIVGNRATDPDGFAAILATLLPGNAIWAQHAPVLLIGIAKRTFSHNGNPNRFALYDLGQAVGHLTVQASALGLSLHQMGGFDTEKARESLGISDDFEVGAAIALGYAGDAERLSDEGLRARHNALPRTRKPLTELVRRP